MDKKELIKLALSAREKAYAPYSHYAVGAAVVGDSGKVYTGCNIENASYPAGICGERTAIFKAISEGERKITMIALVAAEETKTAPLPEYPSPCGICRQVMAEFCEQDTPVLLAKSEDDYNEYKLCELLPLSFTAKDL